MQKLHKNPRVTSGIPVIKMHPNRYV